MAINTALYSSRTEEWPTPKSLFAALNREFRFTLDPCATRAKATCPRYFTKADNGLAQDWSLHTAFCNPPDGRHIATWVDKCFCAAQAGARVVLLIPSRTDTRYFHDWIYNKAEVRFVRGLLRYGDGPQSAPFPSLIAIYRPRRCRNR